ncbi:MBL fold metallo-hydrolase [Schinkia azotoformans]|uniref:RNA-metabolising metallo-beta-lactamase n=1 Tax=Schinkia azotoformans LMG 9581 TaxID=1131731 RepID=K6D8Z9_SCHAZ|nr:MBL fold metallo-hydrolase [Schinkia azotoformans]EKN64809.1 RNA-metabolising metallo-beta-lactamase [Schinkia azotoformans LMG 9581]MEC1640090.1 MBL fold metallo-hydrolase [Schinkia azotoformans]MEC1722594.1 MBL fold metallo-hydrolase [Schinkia azotoformans]MEC1943528.1 MBL fold metallo-hydrolase [Schinkia azotoformans]MED4415451.1 MBL fold metallo-hydrolase [Schinkia azotoformans]
MRISILGGGNEVGASCIHINMGETNLLVDAGMRMHGDDSLPALGMLESLGKLDAVLITHAHADHIGALPIVHSLFPDIPFYATPPTIDLIKIMMKDSYKILEQRSYQMNTLMPYTEEQVNNLFNSLLHIPASGVLRIGDLKITSFRAGHILGAVMFLIEGDQQQLLITGDLSFRAGRTIPGAEVPHQVNPDVIVIESTYGNRAHTDRNTEERLLAEHVSEVISSGGFVLIPAFALGRAQEVLLVLQDYMERGLIPEFPIYVDGLVTPISKIYNSYPQYLKGPVAHRIRKNGDVFITEGRVRAVSPKERNEVLQGKPGCIVASSGMLTGGASSWYAERLISNEKNAIFITGYQDEESPGRKLLNLAENIENQLELNGTTYEVKCLVRKYGLSGHADANEINRFIQSLKPTYTLLVHGDDDARSQIASQIDQRFRPILTENGQTYSFEKRSTGKGVVGKRYKVDDDGIKLREMIGGLILYQPENETLFKLVICTGIYPKGRLLTCQTLKGKQLKLSLEQVAETIGNWNRSIEELTEAANEVFEFIVPFLEKLDWDIIPEEILSLEAIFEKFQLTDIKEKLAVALALQSFPSDHYLIQNGIKFYRFTKEMKKQLLHLDLPIQGKQLNPTAAMETVRQLLTSNRHFIRCGVDDLGKESERLTIYFDFPDAVSEQEKAGISEKIRKETGWRISFSESVRQDLLHTLLVKLLGSSIGSPSIHLNERKVVVSTEKPQGEEKLIRTFKEETGFDLQFKYDNATDPVKMGDKDIFQVDSSMPRLENNAAMEEAKKWARERGIKIYKTSLKDYNGESMLEVHFISPEIAMRHVIDLEELSYRVGMPVTFSKNPKQNEIIRITFESIPNNWNFKKNPSIHMDKKLVVLKLTTFPNELEQKTVSEKINKETGYTLEVIV